MPKLIKMVLHNKSKHFQPEITWKKTPCKGSEAARGKGGNWECIKYFDNNTASSEWNKHIQTPQYSNHRTTIIVKPHDAMNLSLNFMTCAEEHPEFILAPQYRLKIKLSYLH